MPVVRETENDIRNVVHAGQRDEEMTISMELRVFMGFLFSFVMQIRDDLKMA